jgi:hypothetical protein
LVDWLTRSWFEKPSKAQVEFFHRISRGTLSSGIRPLQVARHFGKNEVLVDSNMHFIFWNISSLFLIVFVWYPTTIARIFLTIFFWCINYCDPKVRVFFFFFCDGHLWLAC